MVFICHVFILLKKWIIFATVECSLWLIVKKTDFAVLDFAKKIIVMISEVVSIRRLLFFCLL